MAVRIEYRVVRSNRRSLSIQVGPGGVLVKSPARLSDGAVKSFVEEKRRWIEKHLARIEKANEKISSSGAYSVNLPYAGSMVPVKIESGRGRISLRDGAFVIRTADRSPENLNRIYRRFLRRRCKDFFSGAVAKYAKILGVRPISISFRNQKGRWGSASVGGAVSFNLNLVKAPAAVLEYVVLHELSHLRYHDHSKNFWNLVDSIMPDYKSRKKWLEENRLLVMGP